MTMTERVSIASFMAQNPDLFWTLIHIGWGAIYGSITGSLVFVAVLSSQYLKQHPEAKFSVLCMQLLWAIGQLLGTFSIPWLIGTIDKEVLITGRYVVYWLGTWGVTVLILWWIFRRKFSFKDIS